MGASSSLLIPFSLCDHSRWKHALNERHVAISHFPTLGVLLSPFTRWMKSQWLEIYGPNITLIDGYDQVGVSHFVNSDFPCLHSPDSQNRDGTGSMAQVSPQNWQLRWFWDFVFCKVEILVTSDSPDPWNVDISPWIINGPDLSRIQWIRSSHGFGLREFLVFYPIGIFY